MSFAADCFQTSRKQTAGSIFSISYSDDELGNLLSKSDYGSYCDYGYDANSLPRTRSGGNLICSTGSHNGAMQIHYDPTNKPFRVQRGSQQTEFWYGTDDQRYFQRDNNAGDTIYVGKLFEQKNNGQKKYYLGNYAVLTVDASTGDKITYLHQDRLGSIIAISDEVGNNEQGSGRGFDPFGKPREDDWEDSNGFDDATGLDGDINGYETTTRGFTGHEHLNGTDLIHMNGRAYDYNLGRFLSVDPVIQFPANSQSLNPYSYIMNNPMSGTDPTGYTIAGAGAGAIKSICDEKPSECKGDKPKPGTTEDKCNRGHACGGVVNNGIANFTGSNTTNSGDAPTDIGRGDRDSQGAGLDVKGQTDGVGCTTFECSIDQARVHFGGFDPNDRNSHVYSFFNAICNIGLSGCTEAAVFDALLRNAAPGSDGVTPVETGFETTLPTGIIGDVQHIVSSDALTVINLTLDNHIFADGFVVRGVEVRNGVIGIRSFGEGVNRPLSEDVGHQGSFIMEGRNRVFNKVSLLLNRSLARPGFNALDNNIRDRILSSSVEGQAILNRRRLNALDQKLRPGR